jgi:hypothetical protein
MKTTVTEIIVSHSRCAVQRSIRNSVIRSRLFLSIFVLVLFVAPARPEVDLTKWTEAYLEAAFPAGNGRLRKYLSANEIDYGIDCPLADKSKCADGRTYLQASIFGSPSMRVYERKAGRLRFVFENKSNLTRLGAEIKELFSGGIVDDKDADCHLYMSLHEDRIVAAVVVVSLDASPEKITTCMLVNFNRALGLSLPGDAPFSAKWAQRSNFTIIRPLGPNPETAPASGEFKMSPAFKQSQHAAKILAHIHSCRELVPGMTKSEVIAELGKNSVCLRDLKGG